MYRLVKTKRFEKSVRKLRRSGSFKEENLRTVIRLLAAGKDLPRKYSDHQLTGELKDLRECHIAFDLLLIYQVHKNELILVLIDIGSHSDLFKT